MLLGWDLKNNREEVVLTEDARKQGVYVIGTTGTGKTSLLTSMIVQDMNDPKCPGMCVIDPHGDMVEELLTRVPKNRVEDVVLFAPGEKGDQYDYPIGLNILDCNRDDAHEKELVSSTVITTLRKLFFYSWGPRMEDVLRNGVLTLMHHEGTTLLDLWLLIASKSWREKYAEPNFLHERDTFLEQFWWTQFAQYKGQQLTEVISSSLNKIGRFLGNPIIRNIVCQARNGFDISKIMDEGKILLINLSKGDLGEDNAALLGSVLVNLILIAALRRRHTPPDKRRLFHLYVDEFQTMATESFATLQSEARKYKVTVTVAHQYRNQLDELLRGSTVNVANFVCLRVSGMDAQELSVQFDLTPTPVEDEYEPIRRASDQYRGLFIPDKSLELKRPGKPRLYSDMQMERANQLARLDDLTAMCRIIEKGKLKEHTIAVRTAWDEKVMPKYAAMIRENSHKYAKPRAVVEAEIRAAVWLHPVDPPASPDDIVEGEGLPPER